MKELDAALRALAATAFWCGVVYVSLLTALLPLLLFGGIVFLLLLWALGTTEGRPSLFAWAAAMLSLAYAGMAALVVGLAAYIESHGCATAPETCTGEGIGLMGQVMIGAILLYFGVAWLTVRIRAVRSRKPAP